MGTCSEVSVQAAEVGFLDADLPGGHRVWSDPAVPSGLVRFLACWHWRVAPQARPAGLHERHSCRQRGTWMWPPEPCAQVRILPEALADYLVIRPLSWPFRPCPAAP